MNEQEIRLFASSLSRLNRYATYIRFLKPTPENIKFIEEINEKLKTKIVEVLKWMIF